MVVGVGIDQTLDVFFVHQLNRPLQRIFLLYGHGLRRHEVINDRVHLLWRMHAALAGPGNAELRRLAGRIG